MVSLYPVDSNEYSTSQILITAHCVQRLQYNSDDTYSTLCTISTVHSVTTAHFKWYRQHNTITTAHCVTTAHLRWYRHCTISTAHCLTTAHLRWYWQHTVYNKCSTLCNYRTPQMIHITIFVTTSHLRWGIRVMLLVAKVVELVRS